MEQIRVEHISYSYQNQYQKIEAVKDISCGFEAGSLYAIVGESGSGKSTFLSLLAGLDTPDSGRVLIEGKDLSAMDRDAYRRKQAAVVYQAFHLLPLLTALENVMYPLELQGISRKEAMQHAVKSLEEVGLDQKIFRQYPKMMSGGEQQRVAIARAMAAGGNILLADEPTGNLDSKTSMDVILLMQAISRQFHQTTIMITHNEEIAQMADRIIHIEDGQITGGGHYA